MSELVLQRLYTYLRDFGISRNGMEECLRHTASTKDIEYKDVAGAVLKYILYLQRSCICQAAQRNMKLKSYQKLAVKHMLTHRGMIAAYDVGTGKTLTAVTVANCILNLAEFLGKGIKVIVITPTSLQKNFKKEMEAYGSNPNDPRYSFFTTAKFQIEYKKKNVDCSKSLFIVDEAHVFKTDYRGQFTHLRIQKQDTRAEFALRCASKAWKTLLLTATPIYNRPYDIVNLASMVKGIYPPYGAEPLNLAEVHPHTFNDMYGDVILFQASNKDDFPSRSDVLVKVIMTPDYLQKYEALEDLLSKKNDPDDAKKRELLDINPDEKVVNSFMSRLRSASNNLDICVKCGKAVEIIQRGQKTIFFSEFKSSGTELVTNAVAKLGINYYLITGATPMRKRSKIVDDFNSRQGYNLLFITKAGGEGLDLKGVRNVILFEKGWNVAGQEQVVGRAIRYKSHQNIGIKPKDQNVTVWHMLAVKPEGVNFDKSLDLKALPYTYSTEIVNERYAKPSKKIEDNVSIAKIAGADAYMFAQSIEKQEEINRLKEHLKGVEIGKEKEKQALGCGEWALEPLELVRAVEWGDINIVKCLLDNGLDTNQDPLALVEAIRRTYFEILKLLIDRGANVNSLDSHNIWTPLLEGIKSGNLQIVKLLINHGADVNYQIPFTENTPLTMATLKNNFKIVKFLIESGADVHAVTNDGETALMIASYHMETHRRIYELLDSVISRD